jgi:protein-tyrosine phosphatase
MGFVDLHSHILPEVDDGSDGLETSLAMLRGLAALGFDKVCATPHQKAGQFMPSAAEINHAHARTLAAAAEELGIEIPLGAENMWDAVFHERFEAETIPSYDEGPAFLVEFQVGALPVGLFDHLFRVRMQGKLPVIAHPERYRPLWGTRDVLDRLRAECALVVDLGAVAGYHGRREAKAARMMLKKGIAHAAASDIHNTDDVRVAAEGIRWIEKKLGSAAVDRLLCKNPALILSGEHPEG